MKTTLHTLLATGFTLLTWGGMGQLPAGDVARLLHEQAARQIEAQLASDSASSAQEDFWEQTWRSSEQPGERASTFRWHKGSAPPSGRRIGAICMDDTRQDDAGRGACSGHGGVRFWIYQTHGDSIVLHPSERHWNHPEPLSPEERMSLAASYEKEKTGAPLGRAAQDGHRLGWPEMLLGLMACLTIAYVARLWFSKMQ